MVEHSKNNQIERASISGIVWIVKAMAIVSVLCAHEGMEQDTKCYAYYLLQFLGTIGAPLFFVLSGFFFSQKEDSAKTFWIKKGKRIIIPWLLCTPLVYLHVAQLYSPAHWLMWWQTEVLVFDAKKYILFFLGFGSLYYFVSVLLSLFVVFRIVRDRRNHCFIAVLSLLMYYWGKGRSIGVISPYMNVFNWIWIFAIGVIVGEYSLERRLCYIVQKAWALIVISGIILMVLLPANAIEITYWSPFFPIVFAVESALFFVISLFIIKFEVLRKMLVRIGKDSYWIYLLHMLFQSMPVKYLKGLGELGMLLRPVLLLMITEFMIVVARVVELRGIKGVAICRERIIIWSDKRRKC